MVPAVSRNQAIYRVDQKSNPLGLLHYKYIALKSAYEASFSLNLRPKKHYNTTRWYCVLYLIKYSTYDIINVRRQLM